MGSSTKVKRKDFKTAVEIFAKQMKIVVLDISDSIKIRQEKIAKNLEVARLVNSLIFQIDDKPIFGIDAPQPGHASIGTSTQVVTPGSSIVLAPQLRKHIG